MAITVIGRTGSSAKAGAPARALAHHLDRLFEALFLPEAAAREEAGSSAGAIAAGASASSTSAAYGEDAEAQPNIRNIDPIGWRVTPLCTPARSRCAPAFAPFWHTGHPAEEAKPNGDTERAETPGRRPTRSRAADGGPRRCGGGGLLGRVPPGRVSSAAARGPTCPPLAHPASDAVVYGRARRAASKCAAPRPLRPRPACRSTRTFWAHPRSLATVSPPASSTCGDARLRAGHARRRSRGYEMYASGRPAPGTR